jgi:hypothetical protein
MGGGWTPVSGSDVPQEVVDAVVNTVMSSVAANLTSLLSQQGLTGNEAVQMGDVSVAGCQQVVKGTNYKLWLNMTATVGANNVTLGLSADVYNPLPADNGGAGEKLTVYDIDVEFVSVDGVIIAQDLPGDADDKWDVDADGNIVANGNFTDGTWNTGILADDLDDLLYSEDDGLGMDDSDMDGPDMDGPDMDDGKMDN